MNLKISILLPMFLLFSLIAYASPSIPLEVFSSGRSRIDGNLTFEGTGGVGGNFSPGDAVRSGGNFLEDGGAQSQNKFIHSLYNTTKDGNWSMEFKIRINTFTNENVFLQVFDANISSGVSAQSAMTLLKRSANNPFTGDIIMRDRFGTESCNYTTIIGAWAQLKYDFLDNDTVDLYVNGTYFCNTPTGAIVTAPAQPFFSFGFSDDLALNIEIDNVTFYNCTGSGAACVYPSDEIIIIPGLQEFTLTGKDIYDSSAITNMSLTVQNSSFSLNLSTINGTIRLNNFTVPSFNKFYDIIFRSNDTGGYFNRTFFNINVSDAGSFEGEIFQAILRINATEVITNITITSFNVSVSLQKNSSNSSGFAILLLKAGSYNISIDADGWMTTGSNFSINNIEDNFFTMQMGTANLTVDAFSSGAAVNDFNTTMTLLSTGFSETRETNTGKVVFPTITGTFNITFNSTDFAFASQAITISAGNNLPNVTFNSFSLNSINISIFDEELNKLISSITSTLIFDHEIQKFTNTTSTGIFFISGLFDGLWNLLVSTEFHTQREYIFTIVPQTTSTLNVYLLNSSNGELKTFTVKNKQDQTIPDATISISNKINATFVTVAQSVTDFAGQVNIFLSSTNEYRFTIEAAGFTTKVFDLVPVVSSYNIIMDTTDAVDFTTVFNKVSYVTLPVSSILAQQANHNFSIITSSEQGFISYFGLSSSFNTTALRITNVSGSVAGGTATILINTTNFNLTSIPVGFFIKLNGEDEIRFNRTFVTSGFVTEGNHSAKAIADKYKDRFSDVFKSLLIVIIAVSVILSLAEMGSPAAINGVAGAIIIIAGAIIGWISITVAFIVGFITIGMFLLRRGD